jgi:hypothetical protein
MLRQVENKNRYRTAQPYYYHLHEEGGQGEVVDYLFTLNQLDNAEERARANPEDFVSDYEKPVASEFWAGLMGGIVIGMMGLTLLWAVGRLFDYI